MIFLISIVFSLVFFLSFVFYFGARDWRRMIFQRVHLCIWAIGGHELGTLSIRDWQFMTIHELWNSIIFLNFKTLLVIAPPSSLPPTHTYTHTHTPASLWRSKFTFHLWCITKIVAFWCIKEILLSNTSFCTVTDLFELYSSVPIIWITQFP